MKDTLSWLKSVFCFQSRECIENRIVGLGRDVLKQTAVSKAIEFGKRETATHTDVCLSGPNICLTAI